MSDKQGRKAPEPTPAKEPSATTDLAVSDSAQVKPAQPTARKRTPQEIRRRILTWSFVLCVFVPSVLAGLYYGLVAADQYAVETRFAVRGADNASAPDALGMFTGIAMSGSTLTDSYILMDYIHSKEILLNLVKFIDARKVFNHPKADFISAFSDQTSSSEEFLEYWRKMANVSIDTSSRILTVEVRAFSPEEAFELSKAILELSERLVNDLSDRARRDALQSAQAEVTRMEDRMRHSSEALRLFREQHQDADPALTAQANSQRLSALESQLNEARAKLASQRTFMKDDAPSIQFSLAQIEALEQQLGAERAKLGKGSPEAAQTKSLSSAMENYQGLLLEQDFAQKALVAALSSLERARITADQQQRYLGTFVPPRMPEDAIYPKRVLNTAIFAVIALVLWAIGVLIVYAIRDHAT